METRAQTLGKLIRELREGLGMSQADLAADLTLEGLAGMYPQTIVKLEGGTRGLKFDEGLAIAKVLQVAPEWLGRDYGYSDDDFRLLSHIRTARTYGEEAVGTLGSLTYSLEAVVEELHKRGESQGLIASAEDLVADVKDLRDSATKFAERAALTLRDSEPGRAHG